MASVLARMIQHACERWFGLYTLARRQEIAETRAFWAEHGRLKSERIAALVKNYRCAKCGKELSWYTEENDYGCDPCGGFVNAVDTRTGFLVRGDGRGTSDRLDAAVEGIM